jgi:N-acetylmuramic acid 6-phosphate (MurNAc-6-P) etherase
VRTVSAAAGVPPAAAKRLLALARDDVKVAILIGRNPGDLRAARAALAAAGGDLRAALEASARPIRKAGRARGGRRPRPARR